MFPHIMTFKDRSLDCKFAIFGRCSVDEPAPHLPIFWSRLSRDVSDGVALGGAAQGRDVQAERLMANARCGSLSAR